MWLKYSDAPIMTGEQWDREQIDHKKDDGPSAYTKPRGFWITDDSEDCWRSWCIGERFNLESLTHKHEVVLDEADVLILNSGYEVEAFARQYRIEKWWGPDGNPRKWRDISVDWAAVAQNHTGIIITPYQWRLRMADGFSWYYPWDCASGCIWSGAAIREVRLIEIDHEVARARESEAA